MFGIEVPGSKFTPTVNHTRRRQKRLRGWVLSHPAWKSEPKAAYLRDRNSRNTYHSINATDANNSNAAAT